MNKDGTPIEICLHVCMYTRVHARVRAHARVYQVTTIGSGTTLWRAKAGGIAKCGCSKRYTGREEEKGDVYVVALFYVCS